MVMRKNTIDTLTGYRKERATTLIFSISSTSEHEKYSDRRYIILFVKSKDLAMDKQSR